MAVTDKRAALDSCRPLGSLGIKANRTNTETSKQDHWTETEPAGTIKAIEAGTLSNN